VNADGGMRIACLKAQLEVVARLLAAGVNADICILIDEGIEASFL